MFPHAVNRSLIRLKFHRNQLRAVGIGGSVFFVDVDDNDNENDDFSLIFVDETKSETKIKTRRKRNKNHDILVLA